MAAPFDWLPTATLDAAFVVLLRATAQASVLVLVILAARAALRHRLSPNARYALWILLLLPFVSSLLPKFPIPLPGISNTAPTPAPSPAPAPVASNPSPPPRLDWRVIYEPVAPSPAPRVARSERVNRLRRDAPRWALGVWAVGALVLALRVAVSHARAVRHARRAAPLTDPGLLRLLDQCRRTVRTGRAPQLVAAPPGAGPALLGLLRPRILLPADAAERLSPAELRFVLLHELVHLKRLDVLAEWLLTLLQLAHWFNPLVWLAASRCRADREIACDAAVLALTDATGDESNRADYGRTILKLATDLPPRPRLAGAISTALGILETQSPLERRLRMIAAAPRTRCPRWPAALVATVALALVACTNARTEEGRAAADANNPAAASPDRTRANPAQSSRGQSFPGARQDVPAGEKFPDPLKDPPDWPEISARDRTVAEERDDPKLAAQRARLDVVLPEVNFDGLPLSDAVDKLRELSGANVFVNWRALENAGVDRKAPVSARLRNIKFSKALLIVLDSVGGGTVPLGYTVDDGVVTISTGEDLDRNTITRVYDIRDLTVHIPDYDAPPAHEPPARPQPDDPAARERAKIEAEHGVMRTRQETIDEIVRLVTETVAPDSWRDAGGSTGSIRELQGQLIVTQTPENQLQVEKLLGQLRETRGVHISVETRLISVDDDMLNALPPALRQKVEGQLRAAKDPVPLAKAAAAARTQPAPDARAADPNAADGAADAKEAGDKDAGIYLGAAEVDQILRALQGSARSNIITAPRITLFNGQGAYVLVQSQRAYVADYTVVKQPDGKTAYEPLLGTAQSGIMFWARATVSADRKYATISLHPRLTQLGGLEQIPWHQQPAPGAVVAGDGGVAAPAQDLKVQRPQILVSEMRLTANIPDGATLLLGGLKGHFGTDAQKDAGQDKATHVIMLVKPRVIIQREIEVKSVPMQSTREEKKNR